MLELLSRNSCHHDEQQGAVELLPGSLFAALSDFVGQVGSSSSCLMSGELQSNQEGGGAAAPMEEED